MKSGTCNSAPLLMEFFSPFTRALVMFCDAAERMRLLYPKVTFDLDICRAMLTMDANAKEYVLTGTFPFKSGTSTVDYSYIVPTLDCYEFFGYYDRMRKENPLMMRPLPALEALSRCLRAHPECLTKAEFVVPKNLLPAFDAVADHPLVHPIARKPEDLIEEEEGGPFVSEATLKQLEELHFELTGQAPPSEQH